MIVKNILVQTCELIVLLQYSHTYVLFAANLDDFRSIAKKLIPDKLADQLTDMAAKNSVKYRQQVPDNQKQVNSNIKDDVNEGDFDTEDIYDETNEEEESVTKPTVIMQYKTTQKKRFAVKDQVETIDFEELVEKVREKLRNDQKNNPKTIKIEKHNENDGKNVNTSEFSNVQQTPNDYEPGVKTEGAQYDDYKETALVENEGMNFKEAFLTKNNDSYEDYATPDRENKYESDGATTKIPKINRIDAKPTKLKRIDSKTDTQEQRMDAEKVSRYKEKVLKAVALVENNEYEGHESEEVKAKTETLFEGTDQPNKLKGTMIPTREYYKMSSPNYLAKVPVVAERYDFNEPLPEKDREPEKLIYFGNPPASINKKVKLSLNKERTY